MQRDILRHSNIKKIVLKYTDGKNVARIEEVLLSFVDKKTCLFTGRTLTNFTKPRWRARAIISIYTPEGIYNSEVIIRGVEFTFSNMTYELDIPKEWKFGQLRAGIRKSIKIPVVLKFNDGLEINSKTLDLSIGGFSIATAQQLTSLHTKFDCNFKLIFPSDLQINLPDGVLEGKAIYVRERFVKEEDDLKNSRILCFKFKDLSIDKSLALKNFLIKIL